MHTLGSKHPTLETGWTLRMEINLVSTLANSTLIILFSEMLKFSKNVSSKSKNIVKENSECLRIFHF
jgi:hypothetical protein